MESSNLEKETLREFVHIVQDLSLAEDMGRIMEIVRKASRKLVGSDGATFVLKDGDMCYYADEEAIAPLWKGSRFSKNACISGWVMEQQEAAMIDDIYQDPRIPKDIYRPTFVKSLIMVPIRQKNPLGAIGNYWAEEHHPTDEEVEILRSLGDITAVAIENVNVYNELEKKVQERTSRLEAFSYSIAHDLKNPLAGMEMRLNSLQEDDHQNETFHEVTQDLYVTIGRMQGMIDGLLQLSRAGGEGMEKEWTRMEELVEDVVKRAKVEEEGGEQVEVKVGELGEEYVDRTLFRQVWRNLIANSIKFNKDEKKPRIEIGMNERGGERIYWVTDNGCGFPSQKAPEIFKAFRKLNDEKDRPGSGIGLSLVEQIIYRHGGNIWAEGEIGTGASFFFTLPWRLVEEPLKTNSN